jgi:hypothetical protein
VHGVIVYLCFSGVKPIGKCVPVAAPLATGHRSKSGKRKAKMENIQQPTSNNQHPTTNIEHPTSNNLKLETGDLKART